MNQKCPNLRKARCHARQNLWRINNPKQTAYTRHKSNAKVRGIEFLLSYAEWIDWWGDDYAERGRGANKLVMARIGDVGPYSLDNIIKITGSENTIMSNRPHKEEI